jgi:hypothetical protein
MIAAAAETAAASVASWRGRRRGLVVDARPGRRHRRRRHAPLDAAPGQQRRSQRAAEASNSYADSLKKTTDHLAQVNIQQTVDNLGKAHALTQLKSLQKGNADLGITFNDLTLAVNGSKDQYDSLLGKLDKIAQANFRSYTAGKVVVSGYNAQGRAAQDLSETVKTLRKGLDEQTKQQIALAAAEKQAQVIQDGGNAAVRRQADALHATSDAYLEAQQAAQKNTEQTRQQTLEMQLASDAAGLLNQALMTLAGQNLSVAQAQTSYGQALRGVLKSLHDNGGAIKGNSEKALANQQAVQGSVAAARQLAQATAQQTHSNSKAIASYKESKRELEDQLAAHNKLTPALKRYIDRLFDVKGISDYLGKHPTKTDVNNGPAIAKIDRLEARIKAIRQGRVPGLDANTDAARAKIAELQAQIDALHGKTFTIGSHGLQFSNGQGGVIQRAAGGTVPGVGNTDSQPALLTPGEEVISKGPATKNRALLKAINSGAVVAYAKGGTVGSVYQVGSGYGFQGQYFSKKKDAEKAAADARHSAASQSIFDSTPGSDAWKAFLAAGTSLQQAAASSTATAADVRAAATNLLTAAKAAGLSHKALAAVAADEKKLSADAARRESVLARLGTRPSAPTAYEQLAAAQDTFRSDRQKYADAASGFDVTSVTGGSSSSRKLGAATITTTGTDLTAASILAADAADVAKIKEFDALIHRLVAEGFDQDYVAQIAAKGPTDQAIETARALVKHPRRRWPASTGSRRARAPAPPWPATSARSSRRATTRPASTPPSTSSTACCRRRRR